VLCRDSNGVDPLNYLTLPSLSFNVGMSESGTSLDFIKDKKLYDEVRKATRGEVVNFPSRFVKTNIRYSDGDAKDLDFLFYFFILRFYCQTDSTNTMLIFNQGQSQSWMMQMTVLNIE